MLVKCKFENKNNFEIIDFTEELLKKMSHEESGYINQIKNSITFFYKKNKFYDWDNKVKDYVKSRNFSKLYKGGGWSRPFEVVYRYVDGDAPCNFREMIRNIEDEDFDYILFD
ncbi:MULTISPECIES: hypothetical protein [Clostridium]|uniref:Uncharacterized protein n=1 Tax=Clostridium sporogenes TaxID=1509 RepID=A0AAE6I9W8_CLOSG|nr:MULTISPECIES: hypothetical protein [Clostridium]APQ78850.1 hypothetical protein RSJ10_3687 [Clostridium botulinum]MBN3356046.1 hypothetical protein [Clostridium botulinum]QDY34613.1 hypothetical protein CGS26_20150 [Clostridium sporogenes]